MKLPKAILLNFMVFSTVSLASSRRRGKSPDKDDNSNHPHSVHHKGQQSSDDKDSGDGNHTESGCLDERHVPFMMPKLDDPGGAGGSNQDDDVPDQNTADEIRINKYYAVKRDRFYIRNTGSSLEFQLQLDHPGTDARIRGPDWDDEYILAKGVFHWQLKNLTTKNPDGTTVFNTDSVDPPLEMELVHFASKCGTLEAAAKEPQGVLITGHLFELVGRDNPALEPIARSALSTTFPNDDFKQVHGPLDIKMLFPAELSYNEYTGLYPLNPCANQARFLVFKKPLFVSARQLKRFGGLRAEDGMKISDKLGLQSDRKDSAPVGSPKSSKNTIYLSVVPHHSLPGGAGSTHSAPEAMWMQPNQFSRLCSMILAVTAFTHLFSMPHVLSGWIG